MKEDPELSIIMPVYNEEEYLGFAIESILIQETDFEYEIIIVDDCSTDNTFETVKKYQAAYPDKITYFKNEKNSGNGHTFWQGLTIARGDYFHVLDGDDFFIRRDKLQRQIDFLRRNKDFTAVATNSLRILNNGQFCTEVRSQKQEAEYEYRDALAFSFYFHTSSYMYRNIYKDKVPEFLKEEWARGDGIRTLMHAKHGKIKFLNFIGSVYRFHRQGIWSSLSRKEQANRLIWALECMLDKFATTSFEKEILKNRIKMARTASGSNQYISVIKMALASPTNTFKNLFKKDAWYKLRRFLAEENILSTPEEKLQSLHGYLSNTSYSNKTRKQCFSECFFTPLSDEYCEGFGRIITDRLKFTWQNREYDEKLAVLLVSGLQSKSGGIFREIIEFTQLHLQKGHNVKIISHELVATPTDIFQSHKIFEHENFEFIKYEGAQSTPYFKKAEWVIEQLIELKPSKLYPFASHTDVIMNAAVQPGLAKHVILDFCLDHGISLMITNSAVDYIYVKLPFHYHMLSKIVPVEKLVYIPFSIEDTAEPVYKNYEPLRSKNLKTLTACARSYKVNEYEISYAKTIAEMLAITSGVHIHVGPLSEAQLQDILSHLERKKINKDQFQHIEWAPSLTKLVREEKVDVYLQSFPVGSGRTTVEMMRAGIPVINHAHNTSPMFHASDYCPEECPVWKKPEELYKIVNDLDKKELLKLSKIVRHFYERNNEARKTSLMMLKMKGLKPEYQQRYDQTKIHITEENFSSTDVSIAYALKIQIKKIAKKLRVFNYIQHFRKVMQS